MIKYDIEALEYIGKLSEGGMRDAITLLDKCLAYSSEITLENVVKTLGTVDYTTMIQLSDAIVKRAKDEIIRIIEDIHFAGKDVKQFVKQYGHFLLDVQKYAVGCDWQYINIPRLNVYEDWLSHITAEQFEIYRRLMQIVVKLSSTIKYSATAKLDVEAELLMFYEGD